MKTTTIIVLASIFGLLYCASIASSKAVPGYIFTATKSSQSGLLKPATDEAIYNDQDMKEFVLHNLGMLSQNVAVSESAQNLISQYGNRNYFKQDKLNYVFLLEGASSQSLFQGEKKALEKSNAEHQPVLVDICSNEESNQCLLQHLFNRKDETSVINSLSKITKKDKNEAYVYSTEPAISSQFGKSSLSSVADQKGNIYLVESQSTGKFKIATSLQSCVNNVLGGEFTVNLETRTISNKANTEPLVVPESAKSDFLQFMTDICSVVGTSTLIRKHSNPSFFAFHITSLGKLEQSLADSQKAELYKIFNVAYDQFVSHLLSRYTRNEISGQVLFVNSENSIKASEDQTLLLKRQPWDRVLVATDQTAAGQTTTSTTRIIFGSVLVVFALVTAWVCIEMFGIDVQKDSVVYAKFLAGDYFRR